jgi:hypothetical protein
MWLNGTEIRNIIGAEPEELPLLKIDPSDGFSKTFEEPLENALLGIVPVIIVLAWHPLGVWSSLIPRSSPS